MTDTRRPNHWVYHSVRMGNTEPCTNIYKDAGDDEGGGNDEDEGSDDDDDD